MKEEHAKKVNGRVFPGMQGGPLMHVIAGKAVSFHEALQPEFRTYQAQVVKNAKALADRFLGLGYRLVSGGTDNHLVLLDVKASKAMTGKDAEAALGKVEITVNKNMIPQDTESPFVTSGIRLGTPALTTRGMKEGEMKTVAELIDRALSDPEDAAALERVKGDVRALAAEFPLYPGRAG
jgi:glycine hydroxymethyltransferase